MMCRVLFLLCAAFLLLGSANAFSLRRRNPVPMVQHIRVPQQHQPLEPQHMTASSVGGVINGAPPIPSTLSPIQSALVKTGMLTFIAGMCISLPLTLLYPWILYKLGIVDRVHKEKAALRTGHYCARWLSRVIPFSKVTVEGSPPVPEPTVWVCNHSSMLDVFLLLANDHRLRGPDRRPIKIVYWKQLEDNPVTKLLFHQCGFIPVQMADNGHGTDNDYDRSSFRDLLKNTKQAFDEGFDIGILPEGQLNPTPEQGLLPCFSGAYTLARMAKRPIHMMAHYGINNIWHPQRGMHPTSRSVKIRVYEQAMRFSSSDEFIATFETVVGEYGTHGKDLPEAELQAWMDGSAWEKKKMSEANA